VEEGEYLPAWKANHDRPGDAVIRQGKDDPVGSLDTLILSGIAPLTPASLVEQFLRGGLRSWSPWAGHRACVRDCCLWRVWINECFGRERI